MDQFLNMIPASVMSIIKAVLLLILAFIVAAVVKSLVIKLLNKTPLKNVLMKAHEGDRPIGVAPQAPYPAPPQGAPYQSAQQAPPPQGAPTYQSAQQTPPPQGVPPYQGAQQTMQRGPVPYFNAPLDRSKNAVEYIGKLAYFITFLLFVPGIFSMLGVDSVASPILSLLQTVWGYVPNIIAAVIVIAVGNLVAKLARQLLIPVFDKIKVNQLQEKAGVQVKESAKLSYTLAYIVYVLILIPVIIVALQVLGIRAVSDPATQMLYTVFSYIPSILVAVILIWIGSLIARFAGQIITRLLAATGFDEKIKSAVGTRAENFVFSDVCGLIVQIVLVVFFVVQGVNVLKLEVLSDIGTAIIGYLPNVLACVLILIAAFLAANAADAALEKHGLKTYAIIARVAILVLAIFMVINQLGIATTIVNTAFILIIAAVAVAFAVAFGVGGRDFAKKTLEKFSDKWDKK